MTFDKDLLLILLYLFLSFIYLITQRSNKVRVKIKYVIIITSILIFLFSQFKLNRDNAVFNDTEVNKDSTQNTAVNFETENTSNTVDPSSALDDGYVVTDVIDGDTVKIKINDDIETVRLIGIDAPEFAHFDNKQECFAVESKEYLESLVTGKTIYLKNDDLQEDRDRYKRLLRYLLLENGTNINEIMIKDGYAYEYTYDKGYQYIDQFNEAELSASNNGLGLWSKDTCNGIK